MLSCIIKLRQQGGRAELEIKEKLTLPMEVEFGGRNFFQYPGTHISKVGLISEASVVQCGVGRYRSTWTWV